MPRRSSRVKKKELGTLAADGACTASNVYLAVESNYSDADCCDMLARGLDAKSGGAAAAAITNVNETFKNGDTMLHAAAEHGKPLLAAALVAAGADGALMNEDGFSPLGVAATQNNADMMRALLDVGCRVQQSDRGGNWVHVRSWSDNGYAFMQGATGDLGAVLRAAENGRADVVTLLIEGSCDVNVSANRGHGTKSALILAAAAGHADCVRALIAAGADINASYSSDVTALKQACRGWHVECVKALVEQGGAPLGQAGGWIRSSKPRSKVAKARKAALEEYIPAMWRQQQHERAARALRDAQAALAKPGAWLAALRSGNRPLVERFIGVGASVDVCGGGGGSADDDTPLLAVCNRAAWVACGHYAATSVLSALLKAGADVNRAHSQTGVTPLLRAIETGFWRGAQLLLQNGASVDCSAAAAYQLRLATAAAAAAAAGGGGGDADVRVDLAMCDVLCALIAAHAAIDEAVRQSEQEAGDDGAAPVKRPACLMQPRRGVAAFKQPLCGGTEESAAADLAYLLMLHGAQRAPLLAYADSSGAPHMSRQQRSDTVRAIVANAQLLERSAIVVQRAYRRYSYTRGALLAQAEADLAPGGPGYLRAMHSFQNHRAHNNNGADDDCGDGDGDVGSPVLGKRPAVAVQAVAATKVQRT